MKQQIIEGLKKKLLIVELPEGAINIEISVIGDIMFEVNSKPDVVWLEKGRLVNYLIGKLTDITEEQFGQWADNPSLGYYPDYTTGIRHYFLTAKESFFSKLEAVEIYFEPKNNLEKPNRSDYNFGHGHNEADLYNKHLKSWEEAQEKVWAKDKTWCFEVI